MIRRLEKRDRALYIKMAHDFYHSSAVLHPIPAAYFERTFEECMRAESYARGYILEYDGDTAGYGLISKTYSQEAGGYVYWLEELYILERFRSKGLGAEFIKYLEATKEPGVTRLRLEVEEENTRAIALYKKLGYQTLNYIQMVKDQ